MNDLDLPKVIINGRFLLQRITGVQRYAYELLLELDKIVQPLEFELAVPPETKNIPKYKNIRVVKIGHLHNHLWEQFSFGVYVKKKKAISLNLCNSAPLLSPDVVCIHDVKIKARPRDFSRKFLLWYNLLFFNVCRRAKMIITVSEFSKKEICKYFNVNSNRITVVSNAWQHFERISYDEDSLKKYSLEKYDYYFAMSSLEPNKNFRWIAEFAKKNPKQLFVVAGSINKRVFSDGNGFECPYNMKLLGYITDEEAKTLMRDCRAFLYPTFYEGFGIPPLEAISAGCRNVFVSDTEVMHEVYGNAVSYILPNVDYDTLVKKSDTLIQDEDILKKYSWKKSAEILRDVLNHHVLCARHVHNL